MNERTRPRIGRKAVIAGALTALLMTGGAIPGADDVDAAHAASATPVKTSTGTYAKVQQSEDLAQVAARSNQEPVEVAGLRGERREVFANPDGSFTAYEHSQPVRTLRNGTWVAVDDTLVRRKDGSWSPKAATVELEFSAGGDGPFARMRRAGREYALTWPHGKLPEPTVKDDTATYADVLQGVDLVVRAEVDGLAHLLVVKSAEAARNPELQRIDLGLETDGLNLEKGTDGSLRAMDASVGGTVFEAAKPVMWDSAGATPGGAAAVPQGPSLRGSTASDAAVKGPGDGGRTAPLGLEVAEDRLTLVPDRAMLTGKGTVFPVVIDPIQRTTSRTAWTGVMSGHPTEQDWKYSGSAGAGECPTDYSPVSCNGVGVRRLLFTMPMSFYSGKQILNASFSGRVEHVYWADARAEPVDLYRIGGKNHSVTSSSNWSNTSDDWTDYLLTVDKQIQPTSCSSQANLHFEGGELLTEVKTAAAEGWSSMSLGIRAKDETTFGGWKRICGNTYLKVGYNNPPKQVSSSLMSSNPGGKCTWGTARPYTDELPELRAEARDPDHNATTTDQVKVEFKVDWTDKDGVARSHSWTTGYKSPNQGTVFKVQLSQRPAGTPQFQQNSVIYWSARAYDGDAWGPWSHEGDSQRCEFIWDATRPGAPTVSSAQYPNDEVWHHGVGTAGTFSFAPNPDDGDDTVEYRYAFDGESQKTLPAAADGTPASVTWTPTKSGRRWVTVYAYDAANNVSVPAHYEFKVTDGKPAVGQWNLADEAGGEIAHDESGAHAATPGTGVTFGVEGPGGRADSAARLDGSKGAYLDAGDAVVDTDSGFTVSAWARPTSLTGSMAVISQDGTGEAGFTLGYDAAAGTWVFSVPINDVESFGDWKATAGVTVVKDQWVLLTGVYDPHATGGPELKIYVNNQLKGTAKRTVDWPALGALQIGRAVSKSGYRDNFVGDLAEVRAFDRVLPAAQVGELMTVKPQRKGYWPLDALTDGSAANVQQSGQPLSVSGNATVYRPADPLFDEPALAGEGHLVLDGDGDWAATATPPVTGNSSFTITARAQLTTLDSTRSQTVFSLPGAQADRAVVRYQAATGQWELAVSKQDTAGAEVTAFTDDQELPTADAPGQHLALVYDAFANELRLYVEGQLAATAHGTDDTLWAATGGLQVGRSLRGGGSEYFAGALDEVRVYAGAVDPRGIRQMADLTPVTAL